MEKTVQFQLEDFEGPLDLLLTLLQKNKMSIYEIEIMVLIDQYLDVVGTLGPGEMDDASDFIAMAARLVQMKSVMLLPRSDEAERMKEELTGLLVEYSACKEVAGKLKVMAEGVFMVARRPLQIAFDTTYRGSHSLSELTGAFVGILGRSNARRVPKAEQFDELVTAPIVSVTGRVIYLLRGLKNGLISKLSEPFKVCRSRSEVVATFLALLELVRGGRVTIDHKETLQLQQQAKNRRLAGGREAASGT